MEDAITESWEFMKHYAMKAYWGVDVWIYIFLTLAVAAGDWSAPRTGGFTSEERALDTH
jgi:hypothetical protein